MRTSKNLTKKLSVSVFGEAFALLALSTLGLSTNAQAAPGTHALPICAPNGTSAWELDWQDDFAKAGAPDSDKWLVQTGGDFGSGDEAEFYTDSLKNMRVENHQLIVTALKEDFKDKHYTSGRMISKQGWQYGRFEFRAKLPIGEGTWPAIWMLPDRPRYGGGEDRKESDPREVRENLRRRSGRIGPSVPRLAGTDRARGQQGQLRREVRREGSLSGALPAQESGEVTR